MNDPSNSNEQFRLAASFVEQTNRHLFLTGKAGTGKTTFLHHVQRSTSKNCVVVAPTGVAAINAGGVTMHSFFQLPLSPFIPGAIEAARNLVGNIRFNREKRSLLKDLQLVIVDEVSMVRADMLDAMDFILRHFRGRDEVFGGVQMLFIGDLYQLAPVTTNQDWEILQSSYEGPFFFQSKVLQYQPPVCIELDKVYRQEEGRFLELLNNVRDGYMTDGDLQVLESRFQPQFDNRQEGYITLTTHNHKANRINEERLKQLPGKVLEFNAIVEGDFNERAFPADEVLRLKEGAQVMFLRNDKSESKRYYNGKLAKVKKISADEVIVEFSEEGVEMKLEEEEWKNIRYSYDEEEGILEDVLGSFRQLPIRLAWAITIHKSQGLTFRQAIIDAEDSFTSGQVYVALSRLTHLDGLVLLTRIQPQNLQSNGVVSSFMAALKRSDELSELLHIERRKFLQQQLIESFQWKSLAITFKEHYEAFEERKIPRQEEAEVICGIWMQTINSQQEVADKFIRQLEKFFATQNMPNYQWVQERVSAGSAYFLKELNEGIIKQLREHIDDFKKLKQTKKYIRESISILSQVNKKVVAIHQALTLAEGFVEGWEYDEFRKKLQAVEPKFKEKVIKPPGKEKGNTYLITLEMFRSGKQPEEIARERGMAAGTINGHLARFVGEGVIKIEELLSQERVESILMAINTVGETPISQLKESLGESFSYEEIRLVMNHWKREQSKGDYDHSIKEKGFQK